ncbi:MULTISPECIES: hypothetical protein [Clostridia]|uniref:hypothetical protein n=1 Tax=Clostridia TaxID=186801 RepID=UPI000E47E0BC|nr:MULTISPECIES: hypothetical protein [Clostridia]RHV71053.1 hypothetical protein DXB15_03845 [Roseburia sp. OM02-15]
MEKEKRFKKDKSCLYDQQNFLYPDHGIEKTLKNGYLQELEKSMFMLNRKMDRMKSMESNFQMLRNLLGKYHPMVKGIISTEEKELIEEELHLGEMNPLQLQNLRDFTVLFLTEENDRVKQDQCSAITHLIDLKLYELGVML